MKTLLLTAILFITNSASAAIGCLPGNCCIDRACGTPPRNPTPNPGVNPKPQPKPAPNPSPRPLPREASTTINPEQTTTGVALDTDWKKSIYQFALKSVRHPSWGIAHSERNYQLTKILADKEGIELDLDVVFASAFLHDLGGLNGFEKEGVDHAVRSAELIEPMLANWGFPMEKWPQVKEMILGHTYYTATPASKAVQTFRDSDVLDFLGAIGVARILAITQEAGTSDLTLKPTVDILKSFSKTMAAKCSLDACKELAKPRQLELDRFLNSLNKSSLNGKAL